MRLTVFLRPNSSLIPGGVGAHPGTLSGRIGFVLLRFPNCYGNPESVQTAAQEQLWMHPWYANPIKRITYQIEDTKFDLAAGFTL